ncbi:MAG: hypothetical protein J0L72_04165 [Armatimonadetes bacterium]|nr:hypothetical protein [Armatimonadota bacterium]
MKTPSLESRSESPLPINANEQFVKADLDERYELHRSLAGMVWNPGGLLAGGKS